MLGCQRLFDIPADLRRGVLDLKSHPAIESQRLASGESPDVQLKLIGELTKGEAFGRMGVVHAVASSIARAQLRSTT
jgi:hypothetical protein